MKNFKITESLTPDEKNVEMLLLRESLEAKAINSQEYVDGIRYIMSLPSPTLTGKNKVRISGTLQIDDTNNIITVGKCKIPFTSENRSMNLRVATYLKDNPEEEKGQREYYV
jgi:hypothetical protein